MEPAPALSTTVRSWPDLTPCHPPLPSLPSAGVPKQCDESNVGLWVDALNFTVITLQMALFDTQYTAIIREDTIKREEEAEK